MTCFDIHGPVLHASRIHGFSWVKNKKTPQIRPRKNGKTTKTPAENHEYTKKKTREYTSQKHEKTLIM